MHPAIIAFFDCISGLRLTDNENETPIIYPATFYFDIISDRDPDEIVVLIKSFQFSWLDDDWTPSFGMEFFLDFIFDLKKFLTEYSVEIASMTQFGNDFWEFRFKLFDKILIFSSAWEGVPIIINPETGEFKPPPQDIIAH